MKEKNKEIELLEEFKVLDFFSMDIYLPEKKLGVEILGHAHFLANKT